jgi:hypothetical protein
MKRRINNDKSPKKYTLMGEPSFVDKVFDLDECKSALELLRIKLPPKNDGGSYIADNLTMSLATLTRYQNKADQIYTELKTCSATSLEKNRESIGFNSANFGSALKEFRVQKLTESDRLLHICDQLIKDLEGARFVLLENKNRKEKIKLIETKLKTFMRLSSEYILSGTYLTHVTDSYDKVLELCGDNEELVQYVDQANTIMVDVKAAEKSFGEAVNSAELSKNYHALSKVVEPDVQLILSKPFARLKVVDIIIPKPLSTLHRIENL